MLLAALSPHKQEEIYNKLYYQEREESEGSHGARTFFKARRASIVPAEKLIIENELITKCLFLNIQNLLRQLENEITKMLRSSKLTFSQFRTLWAALLFKNKHPAIYFTPPELVTISRQDIRRIRLHVEQILPLGYLRQVDKKFDLTDRGKATVEARLNDLQKLDQDFIEKIQK